MSKKGEAKVLGVSRGSLYYKSKLAEKDEVLRQEIEQVMIANPGYGYRRVALELGVNKKRAQRVMQKYQLKALRRAKIPVKSDDRGKEALLYPDITKRLSPIAPDVIWASDFTYIKFHGNFVFLCTVIDLFTREVLGCSVMTSHTTELVIRAFNKALEKYGEAPKYLHSDQGSEYTSDVILHRLAALSVLPSLTPKSSPWRNGSQESFFGRLKVEFGDFERFQTLPELIEAIYHYIAYYNQQRIHSAIKNKPSTFRKEWNQRHIHNLSTAYQSPPRPPSFGSLVIQNDWQRLCSSTQLDVFTATEI